MKNRLWLMQDQMVHFSGWYRRVRGEYNSFRSAKAIPNQLLLLEVGIAESDGNKTQIKCVLRISRMGKGEVDLASGSIRHESDEVPPTTCIHEPIR